MASRSRARFRAGGRRLSATARAIQAMRASGRNGLLSPLPTQEGFAFQDTGLQIPLVYPYNLDGQARAVIPANAVPPGVRPWSLGPDLLAGAGEFNSAAGWTLDSSATIAGGALSLGASGTSTPASYAIAGISPGKRYRITANIVNVVAANGGITITAGSAAVSSLPAATTTGWATWDILATGGGPLTVIRRGAGTFNGSIDSITIQEVIYDWSWLGQNLVTNGDNEAAAVTATVIQRGTVTRSTERAQQGSASAKYTCTSPSGVNADHLVGLRLIPAGVTVLIDMWVYVPTGSFASVRAVDFNDGSWLSTNVTVKDQWVRIREVRYKAAAWTLAVGAVAQTSSADFSYFVDSIAVQEIPVGLMVAPSPGGKRMSARTNLLQRTLWAGASGGSPGTPPTGWTYSFSDGAIAVGAPDSAGNTPLTFSASGQRQVIIQAVTVAANTSYQWTVEVTANTGLTLNQIVNIQSQPAGSTLTFVVDGVAVAGTTVPSPGQRVGCALAVAATGGTMFVRFGAGTASTVTGSVTIWKPDCRLSIYTGSAYPAYQRVNDGAAGVFDYDHAGFPVMMQIPAAGAGLYSVGLLDLTATDSVRIGTVAAKLSDATTAVIAETAASYTAVNGSIILLAPNSAAPNVGFASRGTVTPSGVVVSGHAAPKMLALSGEGDISSDVCNLTVNGVLNAGTGDQGTGNYGAHRYYDGGRALDGTASLPATNVRQVGWFADIADANAIDPEAWAGMLRERAAVVGLTF